MAVSLRLSGNQFHIAGSQGRPQQQTVSSEILRY